MISPADEIRATPARSSHDGISAGRYLTLGVRMAGLRCLVVGGGRIGTGKALKLADADARVTVLAPEISGRLRQAARLGRIRWRQAEYDPSDLDGFVLVVAATSDRGLNLRIGRESEVRGILSCVASSASSSRVIFPAVYDHGEISLAVHSHGRQCRLSQQLRDGIAAGLRGGRGAAGMGRVYLVGAGPGSPDLISVRGYRALRSAAVVLADRLVPGRFLEELGIAAAGKTIHWLGDERPRWSQAQINRRLVLHARAGRIVARLKGGDPFVFGRGDAEIDYLSEQGVPWEVIPGCSSAIAVPTAAGLPLTRHGEGRSFAVATARVAGGGIPDSFPRADSLVILMGCGVLDQVVARLLRDGWPPDTPGAVVERGTLAWERRVEGRLSELDRMAKDAGVGPPALIVVGSAAAGVSAVRRRRRILFTGSDPTDFRVLGEVLHWPALQFRPEGESASPHPELGRPLPAHEVIYFAAPAGVRAYWRAYGAVGFRREVWCLDGATGRTLARRGIEARVVVPEDASTWPGLEPIPLN